MDAVTTCIDETMKKVEGRYSPADVAAIGVSHPIQASVLRAMADAPMTIALPAEFSLLAVAATRSQISVRQRLCGTRLLGSPSTMRLCG